MSENYFPYSLIHLDNGMQLDSTKRCLFPVESEPPLSRLRSAKTRSEENEFPYNGKDQNLEEKRNSPISVVSVLCGGDDTINSKLYKNPVAVALSSSSHLIRNLSCDTVFEEQTEIEVQYVEAGLLDNDQDAVENSRSDNGENSTGRKINNTHVASNDENHTPSDLRDLRSRPLLDAERTPSRSQIKRNRLLTPLFGCGGRSCVSMCDDSSHQLVERTITGFLEDSSVSTTPDAFKTVCHDWQDWSYFGFGRKETSTEAMEENPSKENIRSVLRHRTSHSLRARKSNVKQLKQNIAPFAPSPARSPARASNLFRNRSFSVSDHRLAIVRVSKDKNQARGSFTDVLELCTMYESIDLDSPDLIRKQTMSKVDDDDLSYGSDPEDFTRRRLYSGGEGTSAIATAYASDYENSLASPSRSFLDMNNDEIFSNIVQEIFNKTTTLVLHPLLDPNMPGSVQSSRPLAVDAWLERGQHLAYALIQPKWIWKAKTQIDGQSNVLQNVCLHGIELLDITRILKMEETDRCIRSFAKRSHCFFIKSIYDEEFCFEAKSISERNRIVNSLKLLIARFGAKVLTGDPQVYYEFFWTNDGVRGKAPDLHEVFVQEREYCET